MEFRILGPMEAAHDGCVVDLGRPQQRLIMGLLLLERGRICSTASLIDAVWGEAPPPTARASLHNRIASLRRLLTPGGVMIVTHPSGYLLDIDPAWVDAHRFADLVAAARTTIDLGRRASMLTGAFDEWRGPLLADMVRNAVISRHADALDELRLTAHELHTEALIQLGDHDQAINRLVALTAEQPTRERLTGALMVALSRAGRLAEALHVYRSAWQRLDTELGIQPGPDLAALHTMLLAGDAATAWYGRPPSGAIAIRPTPGAVVPAQLPAAVPDFVGRLDELRLLDSLMPAAVIVVTGTGGVGKTTLALRWAAAHTNQFPDGQLFADMRGWSGSTPADPTKTIAGFLRALGVPPDQIPSEPDEAAALYRSTMANRRMFVLIDNVASVNDARQLLPAGPSTTIITSRESLGRLAVREGAELVELAVMPAADALAVLRRLIGHDRTTADPSATSALADLCGYLPLALRIAGAHLSHDPIRSIASYLSELATGDPIALLMVDGDDSSALGMVFHHSYRSLTDDDRRLFRLLGIAAGHDITPEAAAALAGEPITQVRAILRRLASAHLVDHRDGRYVPHDLMRRYARQLAHTTDDANDRRLANRRLYDFYLQECSDAAQVAYPSRLRLPDVTPDHTRPGRFADASAALAWLDREHANLVTAIGQAETLDLDPYAWRLTDALRGFFGIRRATTDGIAAATTAATLARRAGAHDAVCIAHMCAGELTYASGDPLTAIAHLQKALASATAADWAEAEATAHSNIGGLLIDHGSVELAEHHLAQAVDYYAGIGEQSAALLSNLAMVLVRLGRYTDAVASYTAALEMHRRHGQRDSEARLLVNLADVHTALGNYDSAVAYSERAIEICRDIDFVRGEIEALLTCANAHRDAQRLDDALRLATDSHEMAVAHAGTVTSSDTAVTLATVLTALGRPTDAIRLLTPETSGTGRSFLMNRHLALAEAHLDIGEVDAARAHASQALALSCSAHAVAEEAHALVIMAMINLAQGDTLSAARQARQAHDTLRGIGHHRGLQRATAVLNTADHHPPTPVPKPVSVATAPGASAAHLL